MSENLLTGVPKSIWDINGAGDLTIQGFATDISVNKGSTVRFKIDVDGSVAFRVVIYRLGYYGGNGARQIVDLGSFSGTNQPSPLTNSTTGLVDCGNWSESLSWAVPSTAVSGLYIAKLTRLDNNGSSHIVFVVRDDARNAPILFKTSDATWQAYNVYGGNSLYTGNTSLPGGHASKVSYNRPFITRNGGGGGGAMEDWLFNAEYPMIRWMERNGFDVSYACDVDMNRDASLITPSIHKVLLSVGHDEYWTAATRSKFENARNQGVHLGFFSGNEVYWKTRYENSIDGTNTPYRTLVCYKEGTLGENVCGGKCDPLANTWTGLWRDGCDFSNADGCKPENALTGQISWLDVTGAITVSSAFKALPIWRNTSVASLPNGQSATFTPGTLGYEWDPKMSTYASDYPANRQALSSTNLGGQTHELSLYSHSSGALVFGAGTVQWSWGLDGNHDRGNDPPNKDMQQATVNLFSDMGVQPGSLQSDLLPGTTSTDTQKPTSSIASPVNGASFTAGTAVTISGSSSDLGGGTVAFVDVSTDNGSTWQRATGTTSWTLSWTPSTAGTFTIKSRSTDNSGNIETPGAAPSANAITVTINAGSTQTSTYTIFSSSAVPGTITDPDKRAVEVGVKFRTAVNGLITGIRFYKGPSNTGTHVGTLWSRSGTNLARATFTNETASGWQQVLFSTPVSVVAGTTYVASYHTNTSHYSINENYFTTNVGLSPNLQALASGVDGGNGVYKYGANSIFPNSSTKKSNYWVDVIFTVNTPVDVTAPTVTAVNPANSATGISTASAITATFNEAIDPATVTSSSFELRNPANTVIPATIIYNTTTRVATLTPSTALANSTIYTATLKGGTTDPRIKDLAGNALAANYTWSFTTAAATPLTVTANTPANGATGILISTTVTATFNQAIDPATLTGNTFELRNSDNSIISASIAYNSTTRVATLTPSAALANSMVYTATLKGGTTDPRIKDLNGNSLSADFTWSFTTAAATPLSVTATTPVDGASGIAINTTITATFNQAIDQTTLTGATFELRNAANDLITASINYNGSTRVATLTPSAVLANSTVYTATLKGGSTDPRIKDASGNALPADYRWSFTTVAASTQSGPFSIWPASTVPGNVAENDGASVELGVKFRASTDGFITGIRYYKSTANTGIHTANLWSRTGANLARATFSGETTSGWQEVTFSNPVAITAGTTYIASYFTPTGYYSADANYFTTSGVTTPYLEALANGVDGTNGVYGYSSSTTFPSSSYNSSNYWVDVVFMTNLGPDTSPPIVTANAPANGASGFGIGSTITATFNEALDPATVTSSTFQLKDASNTAIPGTISYSSSTRTATFNPSSGLSYSTVYTATLKGGSTDPRIKDLAGNAMGANFTWSFTTTSPPPPPPTEGPGGPILVVSSSSNPFSRYAVEILRAEGLNEFSAMDISNLTPAIVNNYDVVILGETPLTTTQVTMFTDWTNAGGTFIAFRPDLKLASLLGITQATGTRANQYLLVNTSTGPGVGVVNQTIQFHGTADLYTLSGATSLATLYSTANAATTNPAVTSRNVGVNGGQAIAFTYDLARSIVYTRQGNPAWEGQDRDGLAPVRSNDLFYGNASFDRKPDWIDFSKVSIPQADEQQRLLANIIIQGNLDKKPLPRLWYLPKGLKAAVVMTGDDHGNGGTVERFNQYKSQSVSNTAEAVADWTAIRSTSYIYPNTPISNTQLNSFQNDGFEIALHLSTNCGNYTESSWTAAWDSQWAQISTNYPGLNTALTNRTHCIPWSDWTTQAKMEAAKGVRLDANYYYWPGAWIQSRAGMFTGSGIPMRFADLNGNLIDCYQVTTQVTDESDISNYSVFIGSLLDKAKGPEGYYGAFCANMHTDNGTSTGSDAIINSAVSRSIPVISSKQLLTWLDGRNNSNFSAITWSGNQLQFQITAATGSRNMKGMLPSSASTGPLTSITVSGANIPFTLETIKGMEYAFFNATSASYIATYGTAQPLASISQATEMSVMPDQMKYDQNIKLSVYPNPSSDDATAEFSTPSNEREVFLDLYSVQGLKVKRLFEGSTRANEINRFALRDLNLSPGVYFLHLITGSETKSSKMIRSK